LDWPTLYGRGLHILLETQGASGGPIDKRLEANEQLGQNLGIHVGQGWC
jgi:hypothetical protein